MIEIENSALSYVGMNDEVIQKYMCGRCMDLAAAMHHHSGWPICAEFYDGWCGEVAGQSFERIIHAWVVCPFRNEGFDARGIGGFKPLNKELKKPAGYGVEAVTVGRLEDMSERDLSESLSHVIEAQALFSPMFDESCM